MVLFGLWCLVCSRMCSLNPLLLAVADATEADSLLEYVPACSEFLACTHTSPPPPALSCLVIQSASQSATAERVICSVLCSYTFVPFACHSNSENHKLNTFQPRVQLAQTGGFYTLDTFLAAPAIATQAGALRPVHADLMT